MGAAQGLFNLATSGVLEKLSVMGREAPPALHTACLANDLAAVQLALRAPKAFGDVNHGLVQSKPKRYCMPLHLAPFHGPIVNALLLSGAKIDSQTVVLHEEHGPRLDSTVLMLNVHAGNLPMVQFLLSCCADMSVKNADGNTALDLSVRALANDASTQRGMFGTQQPRRTPATPMAQRYAVARALIKAKASMQLPGNDKALKSLWLYLETEEKDPNAARAFDFSTARKWLRAYIVAGAAITLEGNARGSWCTQFCLETADFTPLHWAVADQRPNLCAKYLRKEGNDPFKGTAHNTYHTPYSMAVQPQQHRGVMISRDPCLETKQLLVDAVLPWCPVRSRLWPRSFSHMVLYLLMAVRRASVFVPLNMVTEVVSFLERNDARHFAGRAAFMRGTSARHKRPATDAAAADAPPPFQRRRRDRTCR
jgi:hypothetical protein